MPGYRVKRLPNRCAALTGRVLQSVIAIRRYDVIVLVKAYQRESESAVSQIRVKQRDTW